MRWLSLVVMLAASVALADPSGTHATPVAEPAAGSGSGTSDRFADPKAPLKSLTDDPILGNSPRVNGDEVHGVVAFTFDDGPNPETTPAVIDALEKYDIPATFFIVTQRLLGKHGEMKNVAGIMLKLLLFAYAARA